MGRGKVIEQLSLFGEEVVAPKVAREAREGSRTARRIVEPRYHQPRLSMPGPGGSPFRSNSKVMRQVPPRVPHGPPAPIRPNRFKAGTATQMTLPFPKHPNKYLSKARQMMTAKRIAAGVGVAYGVGALTNHSGSGLGKTNGRPTGMYGY